MPATAKKLPPQHAARLGREIFYTWVGLGVTAGASVFVGRDVVRIIAEASRQGQDWKIVEQCVYLGIVLGLVYGNLVFQYARLGYLERFRGHRPTAPTALDAIYMHPAPAPLAILIPSYKEEQRLVRQAVMSAALQTYPKRRVVLLIDDPPHPRAAADAEALAATRRLVREIDTLLAAEARHHRSAANAFALRRRAALDLAEETRRLLQQYARIEHWFARQAAAHQIMDHTDRLFVEMTYRERVREYRRRGEELTARLQGAAPFVAAGVLWCEYRRLACLFDVAVTSFERKRYDNLSTAPNKAMNLNSYIGLLGRSFRTVEEAGRVRLLPDASSAADLYVPDAKYLITLDADSLLHPDYALRLAHVMEQPGNERLAVVQTPYSAVPAAPGVLERLAGATTDMQYVVHQGFTRHGATFWVGANAMLRKRALEEICTRQSWRGTEIYRFIQDRTVIEDTESSIDMVRHGWQLYNYPERLSYSATPPDFGALVIQRQRWANGGLLILPKLIRHLVTAPRTMRTLREGLLRCHYLASIAWVNLGLAAAILYPFEDNLRCLWLPLTALPYFCLYGHDLRLLGYGWGDLFRLHVLNLMLIPVNLGGVGMSIAQVLTGRRTSFKRTPKVLGRTPTSLSLLMAEYGVLVYAGVGIVVDSMQGRWLHALFAAVTCLGFLYAVVRLIGVREAWEDLWRRRRRRELEPRTAGT